MSTPPIHRWPSLTSAVDGSTDMRSAAVLESGAAGGRGADGLPIGCSPLANAN